MDSSIINFGDVNQKRRFMVAAGALTDVREVTMKPWRPRRSNRANAFYWAAVVPVFRAYLRDQGMERTPLQCHEELKRILLPVVPLVNPATGEIISTLAADTHTMDTDAFSRFVASVIVFLSEMGMVVQDPPAVEERRTRRVESKPVRHRALAAPKENV